MNRFLKLLLTSMGALIISLQIFLPVAHAQVSGKAFEGFRSNSKDPVQIEADELEVLDEQKKAIFEGNVKVRQGVSTITTSKLTVFYAKGSDGGQNDIDKLVMEGGLVATSKQNTVTADSGVYEVKSENITLTGNVVISQCKNVAKGEKLLANLKTNQAKLIGGTSAKTKKKNRVATVFTPGSQKKKANGC